ncbi:MAG: amidase [Deltaproteobacteria bacterium]|nr:amidase [Deltaproteobacteria bacterium]
MAPWRTAAEFQAAYRTGETTPTRVAERVLEAVAASEARRPAMRIFIAQARGDLLAQARAATERWARGEPLSPLDGVPVAVKDEFDQLGYPTTVGTRFLGGAPVTTEATPVARLRAAGALLIGKANMHECGLGATGINPHHGAARNPYAPEHITGGSSSGPGAAVAAGLCPIALGADAGGSIRIPAALCGVTGLKPTFGRVSEVGAAPLVWSLAHVGPLAATVADAALALSVIAGPDEGDSNTWGQPPFTLDGLDRGVEGLRVGICSSWWAKATPTVQEAARRGVAHLEAAGATVKEIGIEYLEWVSPVGYVTIGVEMASSQYENRLAHREELGSDLRLLLGLASQVLAVDYVRAQRLRSLIAASFARAHEEVDLIATPTTACTAPVIRPDAELCGESDDAVTEALTAYTFPANLAGLPAASVPVGYDGAGLPVGLQLIGRPWEELTVARGALAVEARVERRRPTVCYDLF